MTDATFTHPEVFEAAAAGAGWVDVLSDPARIDWARRRRERPEAFVPGFELVDGRPVNPAAPTGIRYGRNRLGHWGPQLCADAIVTMRDPHGTLWIVMVERQGGDGTRGWALPGGYVEPGEDPVDAALRELGEEAGLHFDRSRVSYIAMRPRHVPDPRESDEAWMVTVPVRIDIDDPFDFPELTAGDDARHAEWTYAGSYRDLEQRLRRLYDGEVFNAHRGMLRELLDGPTR